LAWMLAETAARLAGRQRYFFQIHRGAVPARSRIPHRGRERTQLDPILDERWS
jgi:hypothetical protein